MSTGSSAAIKSEMAVESNTGHGGDIDGPMINSRRSSQVGSMHPDVRQALPQTISSCLEKCSCRVDDVMFTAIPDTIAADANINPLSALSAGEEQ
jgi:hypothetical protein